MGEGEFEWSQQAKLVVVRNDEISLITANLSDVEKRQALIAKNIYINAQEICHTARMTPSLTLELPLDHVRGLVHPRNVLLAPEV